MSPRHRAAHASAVAARLPAFMRRAIVDPAPARLWRREPSARLPRPRSEGAMGRRGLATASLCARASRSTWRRAASGAGALIPRPAPRVPRRFHRPVDGRPSRSPGGSIARRRRPPSATKRTPVTASITPSSVAPTTARQAAPPPRRRRSRAGRARRRAALRENRSSRDRAPSPSGSALAGNRRRRGHSGRPDLSSVPWLGHPPRPANRPPPCPLLAKQPRGRA